LPVLYLGAFFSLVVLDDQFTVVGREFLKAASQALNRAFRRVFVGHDELGAGRLSKRLLLSGAAFGYLEQQHSRDAYAITGRISDLLAFCNSLGHAIDGFIGVVFWERTAAPLKESGQVAPNLDVLFACALAVLAQTCQQAVPGLLGQCPFLARAGGRRRFGRIGFGVKLAGPFH